MEERTETIGFEDRGDDYALVRTDADGTRTEIILTATNLGALSRALPKQMTIAAGRRISPRMRAMTIIFMGKFLSGLGWREVAGRRRPVDRE